MSDTAKLKCVEREIALRKNVYPLRVKAGKMTQRNADYEIRIMTAIADDYREKIKLFEAASQILGGG